MRFQPVELEKTENLGHCAPPLVIAKFSEDLRLCPYWYIKAYVKRTRNSRSSDRLLVSLVAPHGASTIAVCLKKAIALSSQCGTGGSTRAASSSEAVMKGASLQAVLAAGDWARASTFRKFYFKPSELSFQEIVLKISL